jgi:hypothetical protein
MPALPGGEQFFLSYYVRSLVCVSDNFDARRCRYVQISGKEFQALAALVPMGRSVCFHDINTTNHLMLTGALIARLRPPARLPGGWPTAILLQ